ncbi:uncharacterized protein MPN_635-like [Centruroides vittatus]|uniref:uncharacterized protein MPN_635-like n=1 Tax=Centruroides vittatus TaxID=120091 RepID=UPI00350F5D46
MTNHIIPREFLEDVREIVITNIAEILKEINLKFFCEYQRENENMGFSFKTENEIILKSTDLNAFYDKMIDKLIREMDEFETEESGWTLIEINNLELRINKYILFRGSSYIELPKQIKDKKAVLNIKNEDEECFAYCIAAYLNPVSRNNHNPDRVSNYNIKLIKEALKGIESPIALQDIGKCEKKLNISVNVYSYEKHCTKIRGIQINNKEEEEKSYEIYLLRITKNKLHKHVNLLYLKYEEKSHYCLINSLSRLISLQLMNHHEKIYICERCLTYFSSTEQLTNHDIDCKEKKTGKIEMMRRKYFI